MPEINDPGSNFLKNLKSNVISFPTEVKEKQSADHGSVKNYLAMQRNKRVDENKNRNYHGGYASNHTNYED